MDPSRFDALTRALTFGQSRRRAISAFSLSALALLSVTRGATAGPGCKDIGKKCKKPKSCCSGVCKGKKGKKKCKGHDAGTCKPGSETATCGGVSVPCKTFNGQDGLCATTTGNAAFCLIALAEVACTRDADCEKELGSHAACVRCSLAGDGRICATATVF